MLADTLHRAAIHEKGEAAAIELAEQLVRTANRLGMQRCYALMQVSDHRDDYDAQLRSLMVQQGKVQHAVELEPLPREFWPSLLELQLDRGVDAAINAILAAMAVVDGENEALIGGRTHRVAGWMFTALSASSMSRRIRDSALRYCASDKRRKWLRFYDPLVADFYWQVLAASQREALLSDIRGWAWLDRWGSLAVASVPSVHRIATTAFSASQWEALDAVAPLNQAWIRARSERLSVEPSQLLDALKTTIAGLRQGLHTRADTDLFAWHALVLGPDFYRREPYRSALQEGLAAGQRYCRIARDWQATTSHAQKASTAWAT